MELKLNADLEQGIATVSYGVETKIVETCKDLQGQS